MPAKSRQNPEVREFILRNVATHPADIGSLTIQEFGLSRTSVNRYVLRLIEEGLLEAEGNTRARRYKLRNIVSVGFSIKLSFGLFEDAIWRDRILPEMKDVPQNVVDICQYGFTEMLNNAIDHSASFDCLVTYEQDYCSIKMMIADGYTQKQIKTISKLFKYRNVDVCRCIDFFSFTKEANKEIFNKKINCD